MVENKKVLGKSLKELIRENYQDNIRGFNLEEAMIPPKKRVLRLPRKDYRELFDN